MEIYSYLQKIPRSQDDDYFPDPVEVPVLNDFSDINYEFMTLEELRRFSIYVYELVKTTSPKANPWDVLSLAQRVPQQPAVQPQGATASALPLTSSGSSTHQRTSSSSVHSGSRNVSNVQQTTPQTLPRAIQAARSGRCILLNFLR